MDAGAFVLGSPGQPAGAFLSTMIVGSVETAPLHGIAQNVGLGDHRVKIRDGNSSK
jgi:hypothetical protein